MNAKALSASDYAGLIVTAASPKKLQIESVQYIHGMLIELGIPASNFDLTTLGYCVPGAEPLTDKREINKALLAFQALRAEKVERISVSDREELAAFLKRNTNTVDQTAILKQSIKDWEENVKNYTKNVESALKSLWETREKLSNAQNMGTRDWEAIIGEIVADGFFKFHKCSTTEAWMEFTTEPVTCTSVQKVDGVRLAVQMGEYKVRMYPKNGAFYLYAHRLNRTESGCIHPFSHDNNICWGGSAPLVTQAIKEGDVGKIFAILKELLRTFNSNNPYRPLEAFINPAIARWAQPYAVYNNMSVGIHPDTKLNAIELDALTTKIRGDSKLHPVWCACGVCQSNRVNHYGGSTGQVGIKSNADLCVDYSPKPVEPVKPPSKPDAKKQSELKKKLQDKQAAKPRAKRKPKIQTIKAEVPYSLLWTDDELGF